MRKFLRELNLAVGTPPRSESHLSEGRTEDL